MTQNIHRFEVDEFNSGSRHYRYVIQDNHLIELDVTFPLGHGLMKEQFVYLDNIRKVSLSAEFVPSESSSIHVPFSKTYRETSKGLK